VEEIVLYSGPHSTYVSKFDSRKDFFEHVQRMMNFTQEKQEEQELAEETRGKSTELKTYYLESNNGLPQTQETEEIKVTNIPTTLPSVNVIKLERKGNSAFYYLDSTDPRFLVLYTNGVATITDNLFRLLVNMQTNKFDRIWLPTETQAEISRYTGNKFSGFGLHFDDLFTSHGNRDVPIGELSMSVSGASSEKVLMALGEARDAIVKNSLCYSKIRIERGNADDYVSDEIRYTGRIITKQGESIDDHINIVEIVRKKYRSLIELVESNSLGIKQVEGRTLIEGQAFELELKKEIPNLDRFSESLLDSDNPFKIWGMINNTSMDMRQIVGVDLHTGDSINLEVMPTLIRVYIPNGGCGNSVLRLYVNLQHNYDSEIRLNEEALTHATF
jgi:hypothetical protein